MTAKKKVTTHECCAPDSTMQLSRLVLLLSFFAGLSPREPPKGIPFDRWESMIRKAREIVSKAEEEL